MELKIEKLSDIVAWADGKIRDGGYYEEKYRSDATTAYCNVKAYELWKIRDVVLKGMVRHSVYTNALENDLASKDKEIESLKKEIEGRKNAFNELREEMANRYITIETHNDICKTYENKVEELTKEVERLNRYNENQKKVNNDLVTKVTLLESENESLNAKIERRKEGYNKDAEMFVKLKEEVKKLNKCVMEKNNTINTANDAIVNLRKEVGAHEEENKRLSEKIIELKKERDKHMARVNDLRMELDCVKASKEKHEEAAQEKLVAGLRESITYWRTQCLAAQEARDAFMKEAEELRKKDDDRKDRIKELESQYVHITKYNELEKQVSYLKKELDESYKEWDTDSKKYQKRDMTLVDELGEKNDKIKNLIQECDYYKNQERIRTDQLRATESKVDELYKHIENIEHLKKKEDDHGRAGFEEYIKYIIGEEEEKFKGELNKRFSEEVSKISQKRTEEELAKAKLNEKFGIPCGEDAIE